MPQKKMEETETVQTLASDEPEAAAKPEVTADGPEEISPSEESGDSLLPPAAPEEDPPKKAPPIRHGMKFTMPIVHAAL